MFSEMLLGNKWRGSDYLLFWLYALQNVLVIFTPKITVLYEVSEYTLYVRERLLQSSSTISSNTGYIVYIIFINWQVF